MARTHDNWERLVTATLRREHLRLIGQRTPSDISLASLSSFSSFSLISSPRRDSVFNFSTSLVGDPFSYHQILQATNYLSESNIIKRGCSGDLYYGVLEGGTQVVVKKIDFSSATKKSFFISELEFLGKVSHYRLVPLIGHCLENRNENFLVYKHMFNMDLSSCLSGEIVSVTTGNSKVLPFLDWRTRLKIATEAAEVLSYLHHECVPPLVHRDIQCSSILLDYDFEVRLGSLFEACAAEQDIRQDGISRGSEQAASGTRNANCAYDVYCFGKVLLELVTGKQGFSASKDSAMQDWMEDVLTYIVPNNKELVLHIVDSSLVAQNLHSTEVWAVALVAKACLITMTSERPQMAHVLTFLQHIESAKFTAHGNLQFTGLLGSVGPDLMIKELLEGSDLIGSSTALGRHELSGNSGIEADGPNGKTFASPQLKILSLSEINVGAMNLPIVREDEFVYQAWLQEVSKSKSGSGSLVAVSRFYLQDIRQLENLQSQVCFRRMLSHPNLVKFHGYRLEGKELCVVHEFIENGSLENHLFRRGSVIKPLSWDTRLKIMIGAARGLAFLRRAEGKDFYKYFDPSDILLDGSYNAKIWGFGTSKIVHPNSFDDVHPNVCNSQRHVYAAPELMKNLILNWHVDMRSYVYGFGVLLVEMLTGFSAKDQYRPGWGEFRLVKIIRSGFDLNQLEKIMDSRLEGKYSLNAATLIANLASSCLKYKATLRPTMKDVGEILEKLNPQKESRLKDAVEILEKLNLRKEPTTNQTAYQHGQQPSQR